jgi:DNA-directed RNA polymerase alpha subunit
VTVVQSARAAEHGHSSDFEKDADIEILTPEVPLATLDKDGVLEMERG